MTSAFDDQDLWVLLAPALDPLPGGAGAGEDLRYSADIDLIREARREDDADLPQGVWKSTQKRAEWDDVIRQCLLLLTTRSKDLQLAAWLLEALIHRRGFAGLAPGFALLDGLCSRYWPDLHPVLENNDPSDRARIFQWLNAKLPVALLCLPVTAPTAQLERGCTFGDLRNAQRPLPGPPDPKNPADPTQRRKTVQAAIRATPSAFYHTAAGDLTLAHTAILTLQTTLDAHFGRQSPGLVAVRDLISEIGSWSQTILRDRGEDVMPDSPIDEQTDAGSAASEPVDDSAPAAETGLPVRNRREAYQRLSEIADILMRIEPHSPTPYLLRRIVQWQDLPLPELLQELTRGRKDVAGIFELLGIGGSS